MKKILFIMPGFTMGGLEKMQVNLANALVKRRYDVTIIMLNPQYVLADELDKRVKLIHKPYKPLLGRKIPYIKHKFYDDGMWETRASAKTLYKYYVGKEKYDVEIAFFRGLSIKIISGSTSNAVKLAWVHSDFRLAYGYTNNFKNIDEARKAYEIFDKVVCVSKMAMEGFIEAIGNTQNLTTVYNFIPDNVMYLAGLEPQEKPCRINAVTVGRLVDDVKGYCRLISAIKTLHDEGLDIGLTIIGNGEDKTKIEDKISELNAGGYVKLAGEKKNPYPYIKNADLLVCSSYYEGYNLTVAEGLMLETPVLSTKCSGPIEILDNGEYGLIVENSEDGLREGLRRLATEKNLLRNFKLKALKRREFFSEEKILKKIQSLFGD